jgi:hypothetical protein
MAESSRCHLARLSGRWPGQQLATPTSRALDCSKLDQRQAACGVLDLAQMYGRLPHDDLERRPHMSLEQMAGQCAPVMAS